MGNGQTRQTQNYRCYKQTRLRRGLRRQKDRTTLLAVAAVSLFTFRSCLRHACFALIRERDFYRKRRMQTSSGAGQAPERVFFCVLSYLLFYFILFYFLLFYFIYFLFSLFSVFLYLFPCYLFVSSFIPSIFICVQTTFFWGGGLWTLPALLLSPLKRRGRGSERVGEGKGYQTNESKSASHACEDAGLETNASYRGEIFAVKVETILLRQATRGETNK